MATLQTIFLYYILFSAPILLTALRLNPMSPAVNGTRYGVIEGKERTIEVENCETLEASTNASSLEMIISHKLVTASVTILGILSLVLLSLCLKRRYHQVLLNSALEINSSSSSGDIEMTEFQQDEAQNRRGNAGQTRVELEGIVESLLASKEIKCKFQNNTITNHFTINLSR